MPSRTTPGKVRAEQFKKNLRALIRARGRTHQQFADETGVPLWWIRKSCNEGVARRQKSNAAWLAKLCEVFGIPKVNQLWSPTLDTNRTETFEFSNDDLSRFMVRALTWMLREHRYTDPVRAVMKAILRAHQKLPAPEISPQGTKTNISDADRSKFDKKLDDWAKGSEEGSGGGGSSMLQLTADVVGSNDEWEEVDARLDGESAEDGTAAEEPAESDWPEVNSAEEFDQAFGIVDQKFQRIRDFIDSLPDGLVDFYGERLVSNSVYMAWDKVETDDIRDRLVKRFNRDKKGAAPPDSALGADDGAR